MAEKTLNCAIYTRKSTEDGLEQEFNSLDAQYEACAAYALSQRHEGWHVVDERYDDGGFSGGNMDRPGLARLLADVEASKVDVILVYKIDRLTRSLADFARIVDVLDKKGASFVSITQAFNTTTSMGRLTLNVLLSFAQFEREVTAERIRDKIAASKKKGLWMGGPVPLGYDVAERRLVVNESEAQLVRHIMEKYLELGCVPALAAYLQEQGYTTKVQHRTSGPHRGGCKFTRGTLYHLLANRVYVGELKHKGEHFAGEHVPIVPPDLFDQVQALIRTNSSGTSRRLGSRTLNLLTGLLTDGAGRAMTPSHATKGSTRYRYYVTRADLVDETPAWRVPAADLEKLVCASLAAKLADQAFLLDLAGPEASAREIEGLLRKADLAAATTRSGTRADKAALLARLVAGIVIADETICVELDRAALMALLGLPALLARSAAPIVLTLPAQKVRRGHQLRLVVPGAPSGSNSMHSARAQGVQDVNAQPTPLVASPTTPPADSDLVALIKQAQAARQLILSRPGVCPDALAGELGHARDDFERLAMLGCLAPDLVETLAQGRAPPGLTAQRLLAGPLPPRWQDQRAMFGFA